MIGKSDGAVDTVLARVDQDMDQARERLFDLLRIPSISTQPAHEPDVQRAAEWLRDQLAGLGFKVAVKPTAGHPVVLGHYPGPAGTKAPRILFYGHYDVQPPDPLELWNSPPFDPQIVEGPHGPRLVARGAVDDKGQFMMFVEALRAWKEVGGGIPAPVTMLLEGEEEIGSPNLEPFLVANKDVSCIRLRADQRHQYVEHRHAGRHHAAAGHVQLRNHSEGSGARPAFRPVRWLRAQSDQCADTDPGRSARRPGPHSAPGLLRRGTADLSGAAGRVAGARFRREGVSARHRPVRGEWRGRAIGTAAHMGPPHGRHQRHLGRLHGVGQQDDHSGGSVGQGFVPAGARPGCAGDLRGVSAFCRRSTAPAAPRSPTRPLACRPAWRSPRIRRG